MYYAEFTILHPFGEKVLRRVLYDGIGSRLEKQDRDPDHVRLGENVAAGSGSLFAPLDGRCACLDIRII